MMAIEGLSGAWSLCRRNILYLLPRRQVTCTRQQAHRVMHMPAILTGYRLLNKSWSYYLRSLFQVHNETANVWTHLVGCVILIHQLYSYSQIYLEVQGFNPGIVWTLLPFGVCCLMTLLSSAMAHLLHSKSPHVNCVAFMFDYIGIAFWMFGTGVMAMYGVSDETSYNTLKSFYVAVLLGICYINFVNICVAKIWYCHDISNIRRKFMMVAGIGSAEFLICSPFMRRYVDCYYDNSCSWSSLNHITVVVFVLFLIGVVFSSHQPEKAFPGWFDIIGQSHHIFHVLVILCMSLQLRALYVDSLHGRNTHCHPEVSHLFICMSGLYVVCVLTILYFKDKIAEVVAKFDE